MPNLSGIIKSIQNIRSEDHGVNGDAQRLWMLFFKIFDKKKQEREIMNHDYKLPITEELRWRN